jgi:hypothetical protein
MPMEMASLIWGYLDIKGVKIPIFRISQEVINKIYDKYKIVVK